MKVDAVMCLLSRACPKLKTYKFKRMEAKKLTFKIGEENKPVIYGLDNFHESMFLDQLLALFSHVRQKLEQKTYEDDIFNDIYDNNIIAFVGERGAGKTSCMYSGINVLKEAQEKNGWQSVFGSNYTPVRKLTFMKTIDPSCFDNQHNILEMLIGEMYREALEKCKKGPFNKDLMHSLIIQFQETKKHLRFLSASKPFDNDDDELEELAYLSSGVDLRDSMRKLIDSFLKFMDGDVLVIGIDDIHLNTIQAFSMVEQIRKYLILPQAVILMAVKLDQLDCVIRQKMTDQFKNIMTGDSALMTDADISEMVERYLNKLIPLQSRIFLPQPSIFYDWKLEITSPDGETQTYDQVREAIPSLIFSKCRYLFYNTKGTTSMIVPRNLRNLRMLIRMLFVMKDYEKNDLKGESEANKDQFKHYLFGTWLDDMGVRYRHIAHELISETEPTLFNKKVLELLKPICGMNDEYFVQDPTLVDVLNSSNKAYNVSVGDTLHVLRQVESMQTSEELRKLIFFVKSLLSIRLYEYYDRLSGKEETTGDGERPYRGQNLENISNYEKLMGGSVFLLEGDTLLPKENGDLEREIRNVQGGRLMSAIKEIVETYEAISDVNQLATDVNFKAKLMAVEFFMLTVSRYIWTVDNTLTESGIHKFRLQSKAYYDRTFDIGTESMMFDILAPFFTMVDIKHSYDRFNGKIFEIANKFEGSLYHQLQEASSDDGRSFISKVCIRNVEIIDDLYVQMQSKRGSYRMSENASMIKSFYRNLASYSICTYDKKQQTLDGGKYYRITFPVFGVLANLFDNQDFVSYFSEIYNILDVDVFTQYIELKLPAIWSTNKSMKGSTVLSRIHSNYPYIGEVIGEAELSEIFESEKTYKRNVVINKKVNLIKDNPALLSKMNDNRSGNLRPQTSSQETAGGEEAVDDVPANAEEGQASQE